MDLQGNPRAEGLRRKGGDHLVEAAAVSQMRSARWCVWREQVGALLVQYGEPVVPAKELRPLSPFGEGVKEEKGQ